MTKIAVGPRPDKLTPHSEENRYALYIDGIETAPIYAESRDAAVRKVVACFGVPRGHRIVGTHQDRWVVGYADENTFEIQDPVDLVVEPETLGKS